MKKSLTIFILVTLLLGNSFAQVYSDKIVGAKNEALKDSLISAEYPYMLPIGVASKEPK